MPTPTKGKRLGGSPAHQRLILANLATSLFEHGRITTTEAKARRLRPFAERLITKAKHDVLHNRRQVLRVIHDKSIVHALFTEIGPNYATRPGGYTRITKIGPRKGDNAAMAVIELVEAKDFSAEQKPAKKAAKKSTAKKAPAKKAAAKDTETETEAPAAESPAEEAPAEALAADEKSETPVEQEAREEEAAAGAEAPYGADSAAPLDDRSAPEGFEIKAKESSKKFHTTDSPWYDRTEPDVWFRTEAAAEAAGFEKAGDSESTDDDS